MKIEKKYEAERERKANIRLARSMKKKVPETRSILSENDFRIAYAELREIVAYNEALEDYIKKLEDL